MVNEYYGNESFEEWCAANPYHKKRKQERLQLAPRKKHKRLIVQRPKLKGKKKKRGVFVTARSKLRSTPHTRTWNLPTNNEYLIVVEGFKPNSIRPYYLDELDASTLPNQGRAMEVLPQPMKQGNWTVHIYRPFSQDRHLLQLVHESFDKEHQQQYQVSKYHPNPTSRRPGNNFLASISLAVHDGFESGDDSRLRSNVVAQQCLETARSIMASSPPPINNNSCFIPMNGGVTVPVDLDATVQYQLKLYCDHSQRIVGVDVIFPFKNRWSLGSSDHLGLTERHLQQHTNVATRGEDQRPKTQWSSSSIAAASSQVQPPTTQWIKKAKRVKKQFDDGLSLTDTSSEFEETPHPTANKTTTHHHKISVPKVNRFKTPLPDSPPSLRTKNLFGASRGEFQPTRDDDCASDKQEDSLHNGDDDDSMVHFDDAQQAPQQNASPARHREWPSFHNVLFGGIHDESQLQEIDLDQIPDLPEDYDNHTVQLHDVLYGSSSSKDGDSQGDGWLQRFLIAVVVFVFMLPLLHHFYWFLIDLGQPKLPSFAFHSLGHSLPIA